MDDFNHNKKKVIKKYMRSQDNPLNPSFKLNTIKDQLYNQNKLSKKIKKLSAEGMFGMTKIFENLLKKEMDTLN